MKGTAIGILISVLCLAIVFSVCACDLGFDGIGDETTGELEGKLYFHNSKNQALLIDKSGGLTWLYSKTEGIFDGFNTGDTVKVSCGAIMESYPMQTYITEITLISEGDVSGFTESELSEIQKVIGGFN